MSNMLTKPTIEQTAWVFERLCEHLMEGGTFRYLIYDRLGYGPEAYQPLYEAGGMVISNAFCELEELQSAKTAAPAPSDQSGAES